MPSSDGPTSIAETCSNVPPPGTGWRSIHATVTPPFSSSRVGPSNPGGTEMTSGPASAQKEGSQENTNEIASNKDPTSLHTIIAVSWIEAPGVYRLRAYSSYKPPTTPPRTRSHRFYGTRARRSRRRSAEFQD